MATTNKNNFRVGHLNVRSLMSGFHDFSDLILKNSYDIFGVSETWLSDDVPSTAVNINGYELVRRDRGSRGGGVAFYVKNSYKFDLIENDFNNSSSIAEHIWLKLKIGKSNLALGLIYRPPQNSTAEFINLLDDLLSYMIPQCENIVIIGDFNINFFNLNSSVLQCFNAYGFCEVLNEPTRVTCNSASLIDQIFVNNTDIITNSGTINTDLISDHSLIFCELTIDRKNSKQKFIEHRSFKYFDERNFLNDLHSTPWDDIFYINNINTKVTLMSTYIQRLFDIHAPIRTVRVNKPAAPWLSDTLKIIMSQRDAAFRKFKRNRTTANWQNYKELRNYALASIRREKSAYINFLHNQNNSSKFWKTLKNMNIHSKKNINLPPDLINPSEINDYFLSIFENNTADIKTINYYNNNKFQDDSIIFQFKSADASTINDIINNFTSNAAGWDKISLHMLKLCIPHISPHITHIINCCLEIGYFPDFWKIALIYPLAKISNPSSYNDLRPISLLPILSKVLEKVVYIQLYNFAIDHNILPPEQSGFRKGYSTTTALLNISDNIIRAIDNKLISALILLDFSKAFDKINHEILCAKLKYYGCNNVVLSFFRSYLFDRYQKVEIDNQSSSLGIISSGVPQGSVLGPLLFLLYTADIFNIVKSVSVQLYADDTQLMYTFKAAEHENVTLKINHDLNAISLYAKSHNMKLNPQKSVAMLFGTKHILNNLKNNMLLVLNNDVLEWVDVSKNLGVYFDNDLRFRNHVSQLLKSTYVKLKLLYSNRCLLNFKIKKQLCETLILPVLYYCLIMYFPCLDFFTKTRLQKVQNSCCRFIHSLRKFDHISKKITDLKWLNIENTWKMHLLTLTHKLMMTSTPEYLKHKFISRENIHSVNIRHKDKFTMPQHSTAMFHRSFTYNAIREYNLLAPEIKKLPVRQFNNYIKSILISNQ